MTLSASAPIELSLQNKDLSNKLDEDIERVRAAIQSLTKRKNTLVSSLLSSTKIQAHLKARETSNLDVSFSDQNPLQSQIQHNETNVHRLALGVTAFPFTDPNPDTSDRPLLGVRFDIPGRSRRFKNAPYYIFFKPAHEDTSNGTDLKPTNTHDMLKIHHHTIPAFVPLQEYEDRYLPQTASDPANDSQRRDEGYFSPSSPAEGNNSSTNDNDVAMQGHDSTTANDTSVSKQDLHALVAAVRHDLVSWQLRNEAILLLAEQLNLSENDESTTNQAAKFSPVSLQATAADARFCRLVWQNGTVGRLRLTDDGFVDRAVVIGEVGKEGTTDRLKSIERMLSIGPDGRRLCLNDLVQRLDKVAMKMKEISLRQDVNDQDDGTMAFDTTNDEN